jgi:hypothetical protein
MAEGIEFSAAVALTAGPDGRLVTEVPRQVAERLGAAVGDVLCWTGFESGTVEVWIVKKSPYASLGSEGPEESP